MGRDGDCGSSWHWKSEPRSYRLLFAFAIAFSTLTVLESIRCVVGGSFGGKILSLYQGLGTKNLQSFIAHFVYFYGYRYFKRLYPIKYGTKSIGTKANLILAAFAGACTAIITQVFDSAGVTGL